MPSQHLAQLNVAQARWTADRPEMADFYAQVPLINTIAEASPGFVWRLKEDYGDPLQLVNLSVWESVEALREFAYRSAHAGVFRDRERWFEKATQPSQVLWWIPIGHRPGYAEGFERLETLRTSGATQKAFTFAALADSD
jgi:heme-degrading monooxygenase HmoA